MSSDILKHLEELYDAEPEPRVYASDISSSTVNNVKNHIKDGVGRITNVFSRYRTSVRDRLLKIPYRIRSLPDGIGGQYSPSSTAVDISSTALNSEFGKETVGHEMIHAARDAVVGLGNLLNKYVRRYGLFGYFLFKNAEEGLTTHLYEDTFKRTSRSLYTRLGINKIMKKVREKLGDRETIYSDSTKPGEEFLRQTGGLVYLF